MQDYSDPQMQLAIQMGIPLLSPVEGINHVYGYVDQNPINLIDPYGLDAICGNNAVWIPEGGGNGYCRPTRQQPNQCVSGMCTFPPATNDACVNNCMKQKSIACIGSKDPRKVALCVARVTVSCAEQTCDKCDDKYKN